MNAIAKSLVATTLLTAACATTQVPPESLSRLQGSLRAAQEMGAEGNAQAALYLQYAREAEREARKLIEQGATERGAALLERSEADAQVALAILRTAEAEKAAKEAKSVPPMTP